MLHLYDLKKVKIRGLTQHKDYSVESVLSSGDKVLSFLYPSSHSQDLIEESYIRTKTDEFIIKEVSGSGYWKSIKASLNVEDLEGKPFENFDTTNKSISECLNLAIAGTGWKIGTCDINKNRTVRKTNSSSWDIIQEAKKIYKAELEFDTINKIINVYEKRGSYKGTYLSDTLNLTTLDITGNSYDFYTRIIAIGKDNIKVEVKNNQYSNKVKTLIWKDERYTDIKSLEEDARAKLDDLSKPYRAYSAQVIDLAKNNDEYKNILDYSLGDEVIILSKNKKIREKQRVVKITEYPEEAYRNTCEIANLNLTFEEIQKDFKDAAETVDNITTDNGTINGSVIDEIKTEQIKDFDANVGKVVNLEAVNVRIDTLYAEKASVGELNAVVANIGELNATKANITDLNATNANIINLEATTAKITDLNAISASIGILQADSATIKNLLAGNITSGNIQAGGITSDKLTIENGFITNAMIANLDVSKVNAGDISTSKFRIKSDDGGIEIVGATQQFKDKNNKVRIQMGKDSGGNFNFILRGEDGTTTLIDHTGIKKNAIADNLIISDMIATDAVGEKQVNYSSFTTGFNKSTNTNTINSSKVMLDGTNQTLNVAFNKLETTVNTIEIGGRNYVLQSTKSVTQINGYSGIQLKTSKDFPVNILKGKQLTLSCDYSSKGASFHNRDNPNWNHRFFFEIAIKYTDDTLSYFTISHTDLGDKNTRLHYTSPIIKKDVKSVASVATAFQQMDGELKATNFKIEIGNKYTDFIIAPEDVEKEIQDVVNSLSDFEGTVNGVFKDGVIEEAEAKAIKQNLQILDTEKTNVDYEYTTLRANSLLVGSPATNLANAKTSLNTAHDSLKSVINNAIADGKATTTEVNNVNSSFSTYRIKLGEYKQKYQEAIDFIGSTKVNNIEIGGRNLLKNSTFNTKDSSHWSGYTSTLNNIVEGMNGNRALKVTLTSQNVANTLSQTVYLEGNTEYVVSVWIKTDNVVNTASNFLLSLYGVQHRKDGTVCREGGLLSVGITGIKGTTDWTKYTGILRTHTETTRITFYSYNRGYTGSAYYSEIMFEKGNKNSEWSPAHGDIDSAIQDVKTITTSNSTTIGVMQGEIKTAINNTQIVKDGETVLLKDDYSRTVQTVNSMSTTIGTHTSEINGLNSKVNINTSTINQLKDKIELKVESSDVTTIVNSVKTELDGKITTIKDNTSNFWAKEYRVNTATPLALKEYDGISNLDPKYWYEVEGFIGGTNTDNGALVVFKGNGTTFTLEKIIEKGTSSNQIEFYIENNIPKVRLYNHTSHYGVMARIRKLPSRVSVTTEVTTIKASTAKLTVDLNTITGRVNATESTTATINTKLSVNEQTKMNGTEYIDQSYYTVAGRTPFTSGTVTQIGWGDGTGRFILSATDSQFLKGDFIPFNPSKPIYTCVSMYNKDTSNGTFYVGIEFYNKDKGSLGSNDYVIYTSQIAPPAINTWRTYEGFVEPSSLDAVRKGAAYIRLRILTRWGGGTGVTYLENIHVKQLESTLINDINNSKIEIKKTNDKVAEHKIALDSITSRVSATESTTTTITTNVNKAQADATNGINKANAAQTSANNAQSTANTANTNATNANTNANSAKELAHAMANGKLVRNDPMFKNGVNGCSIYNNSTGNNVTLNRIAKPTDCPTSSTHCLEIKTIGSPTSPGFGGFYCAVASRANAKFIVRVIAKIPIGRTLNLASNSMGTGYTDKLLTSNVGTGNYTEYIREIKCGSIGTFSAGGHFYISGGSTPTSSAPLVWTVASCAIYDVTDCDYTLQDTVIEVSKVNEKVAEHKVALDNITSRVSATESTTTSINGKVVNLETRVTTAEQKITPTAITNTISTAINNGTASINTVSTVLDKNGLTVNNGALMIKNKQGVTTGYVTSDGLFGSNRGFASTHAGSTTHLIGGVLWKEPNGSPLFIESDEGVQFKTALSGGQGNKYVPIATCSIDMDGSAFGNAAVSFIRATSGSLTTINLYNQYVDNGMNLIANAGNFKSLSVSGSKNCVQTTNNFGDRLINAYETAEYYFGDIGSGDTKNGICIIHLDPILLECINTECEYQVFITTYGRVQAYVAERNSNYFIVKCDEDVEFGWEIKAKRKGYENTRLSIANTELEDILYVQKYNESTENLKKIINKRTDLEILGGTLNGN